MQSYPYKAMTSAKRTWPAVPNILAGYTLERLDTWILNTRLKQRNYVVWASTRTTDTVERKELTACVIDTSILGFLHNSLVSSNLSFWDAQKVCITSHILSTFVALLGLDTGVPNSTSTFQQLCFKAYVIGSEPIGTNRAQIHTSWLLLRNS